MARIRTVKPEFWTHPKVARIDREARLAFIGMLNQADDHGRLEYVPRLLLGAIFPYDHDVTEEHLLAWISQLSREGLVRVYRNRGRDYISFPGWDEHQRVDKPAKPRCPDPDDEESEPLTCGNGETRETLAKDSGESLDGNVGTSERRSVGASDLSGAADAAQDTPHPPATGSKQDPIWDAVVNACHIDTSQLTKSERGRINKAVKELRDIHATPDDIHTRAREYRRRWPTVDLTATALAANYGTLGRPPPKDNNGQLVSADQPDDYFAGRTA